MKVETFKCDACNRTLDGDGRSRERWFEIRSAFSSREFDICRECWQKMCAAVGLSPEVKSNG